MLFGWKSEEDFGREEGGVMFKFELGQEVKDSINGFQGIIVCRMEYLDGCRRYSLQSKKLDGDGKPLPLYDFDEKILILIESESNKIGF